MDVKEDYAFETAIEIAKEIAHTNSNLIPNKIAADSMADFIETLYKRLSKIELNV